MSEYEHPPRRPSSAVSVEQLFTDLAARLEHAALLYGNAAYFDLERARRIRQAFDSQIARAEFHLNREASSAVGTNAPPSAAGNRAQRIETEILAFLQDIGKPVTIDEVTEHLTAVALGEPRPSLITRMSRMVGAGKLTRSGRGYYEPAE